MQITTPHGIVRLSRSSGERGAERLASAWRLPVVRHGDGDYGIAFQVGHREAWCTLYALPAQNEAHLYSVLKHLMTAIRESLVKMAGVGQEGVLLPCAFVKPDDDDKILTGVAVFSSDQPPVGGAATDAAPIRDRFIRTLSTSEAGAVLPAFERTERLPRLSVGMMKLEMALVAGEPLLLAAAGVDGQLDEEVEASLTLWARRGVKHIAWAPSVPRTLSDDDVRSLVEVSLDLQREEQSTQEPPPTTGDAPGTTPPTAQVNETSGGDGAPDVITAAEVPVQPDMVAVDDDSIPEDAADIALPAADMVTVDERHTERSSREATSTDERKRPPSPPNNQAEESSAQTSTPDEPVDSTAATLEAAALRMEAAAARLKPASTDAASPPDAAEALAAVTNPSSSDAVEPMDEPTAPVAEEPTALPKDATPSPVDEGLNLSLPSAGDGPSAPNFTQTEPLPLGRPTQPLFFLHPEGHAAVESHDEPDFEPEQSVDRILDAVLHNPFSRLVRVAPDGLHAELIAAAFEVCIRVGRLDVIPAVFGPTTSESIVMGGIAQVELLLRHSPTETCALAVRAGTGLDLRSLRALTPVMQAGCSHLAVVALTPPRALASNDVDDTPAAGADVLAPWQLVTLDAMLPMIEVAAEHSLHPDFFRAHAAYVRALHRMWVAVGDAAAGDGSSWQKPLQDAELLAGMERMLAIELLDSIDASLEPKTWPRMDRSLQSAPTPLDERALTLQVDPQSSSLVVAIVDPHVDMACGVTFLRRKIELFVEPLNVPRYGRASNADVAACDALLTGICTMLEIAPPTRPNRRGQVGRRVPIGDYQWLDGVSREAAGQLAIETVWLIWHHFEELLAGAPV